MGGPRVASRGPAPPPRICRHRPGSTREGEVVVRMNWLPHPRLLPRRPRLLVPASPEPPPSIHTCPRGSARGNLSSEPLVETQALRAGDPDLNPSNLSEEDEPRPRAAAAQRPQHQGAHSPALTAWDEEEEETRMGSPAKTSAPQPG